MLRHVVIAGLLADVLAAQTAVRPVVRTAARQTPSRVVIDAGHGGRDPGGPMRHGIAEKDVTLQVALKVGDALRARGVEVVFTRTTDTLIALDDRGRIANQARGQLFISIHVNAANPHWRNPAAARGFETYFLAEAKTDDARRVEETENAAVQFESGPKADANDPLGFILSDMKQNEHLRESSDLADLVQRHLHGVHPGPDRGVKQAGFRVLVSTFMPAVLVELGFGTNREDAAFISNPAKQRAMAKAIADATTEYLERYQRRVGGGAASHTSHD
ncbi:MAG: N-acetylmuramoyl-L-alanine amidase family protein [Gemmatimonadaceae bacterium]